MPADAQTDTEIGRALELLGGEGTFQRPVRNRLDAHDLLVGGLPTSAL